MHPPLVQALRHVPWSILALALARPAAVGQIMFERTYGGPDGDFGFDVQQTSDGGYALFGATWNTGGMSANMYLVKTDDAGNEQWSRNYGHLNTDMGYGGRQTSDGGYILCGMFGGFGTDSLALVRTDAAGNALWMRTYPGTLGRDIGYCVEQTGDGGFIVCGFTEGVGVDEDIYLVRTDANGDTLWTTTLDLGASEVGSCLRQTANGDIVVLVNSFTFADPDGEIGLVRFDPGGDTLWTRTYASPGPDETHGLAITNDGGFIIAGGNGSSSRDIVLLRTDANGNEQWRRTYLSSGDEIAYGVVALDDGGFAGCGRKENLITGQIEMHLFRTDPDGYLQWERTFTQGVLSEGRSLDRTSDGGFAVIGYTTDTVGMLAYSDMYLVKTDGAGYAGLPRSAGTMPGITVFPNPVSEGAVMVTVPMGGELRLIDADGRTVRIVISSGWGKGRAVRFDLQGVPPGIYLLSFAAADVHATQRVVVQ